MESTRPAHVRRLPVDLRHEIRNGSTILREQLRLQCGPRVLMWTRGAGFAIRGLRACDFLTVAATSANQSARIIGRAADISTQDPQRPAGYRRHSTW
jgi:hypothetical protein